MITKWASCSAPIIRLPISTLGESEAVLMEDWHLVILGRELTVPAGTSTDGASIPRALWRVCGHPLQSPRVYAALAHDYIYRNAKRLGISRKEADRIYKALLRHFGISAWVAGIEYTALRLFGGSNYKGKKMKDTSEKVVRALVCVCVLLFIAACVIASGCKSIEVERHAQSLATVANADGTVSVVRDAQNNPVILDGGWAVDYFQHWNWQEFDSLSAKAGAASLDINNYRGGADATNLTALISASFDGGTKLVTAIGEAYVKIAGGGAQASTVLSSASKIYEYFIGAGGDPEKATVSTDTAANLLKVSDGTTCVQCDAQGNCSSCMPQ